MSRSLALSILFAALGRALAVESSTPAFQPIPPARLWERFEATAPPFTYTVVKDEAIASSEDPSRRLRRVELLFSTQEVFGETLRSRAELFIPIDDPRMTDPARRGRVAIVGGFGGPFWNNFVYNFAHPIATRTGYPTMILECPGHTDSQPDREWDIRPMLARVIETNDPFDHHFFRLGIVFVRAMEVCAAVLEVPTAEIRAVIGGHSKRATAAYTAAAIRPENVAGIVYMGNESVFDRRIGTPLESTSPYFTQRFVRCPVIFLGATNESGYRRFNINRIQSHMDPPWTIAMIPNYRHDTDDEKHFVNWPMWVSHCLDGRPVTRIVSATYETQERGTRFYARLDTPNTVVMVKLWTTYNDDPPYWRDLMWFPVPMFPREDGCYEAWWSGKPPDAWLIEVEDVANGFRGYVTTLPVNHTGGPSETPPDRYGMPRLWEPPPAR
ncbi:hypothetical protein HS125_19160 [bacterium]|nr:hypothetical protein [bacterium]